MERAATSSIETQDMQLADALPEGPVFRASSPSSPATLLSPLVGARVAVLDRIAYPCDPIPKVATMPAWSDGQMNVAGGGSGARLPTRCSFNTEKSPRVNM